MKNKLNFPLPSLKYNLILTRMSGENHAYDKEGNELDLSPDHNELLNLVGISGIEAVLYCVNLKGVLNVILMYYPTGATYFTEAFHRKYLKGMKIKFVEPEVSGAGSYFMKEEE